MNSPGRGPSEAGRGGKARAGGGKATELITLGGVQLVRQGVDETSKLGPKHLALLIYLFHERRPMHPSEVIELLGRGQDDGKEMEALTRAVTWLRENVPGTNVRLTAETIEAFGGVTIDTREVDTAIDGGHARQVAELYNGEFLEGFQSGAPAFDEWAAKERGRLKRAWSHAMLAAAHDAERRRRWELAADWWRVLVARAPMRPEAVAGLLGALADSGQNDDAARAYADYIERLKESGIGQPADLVKEMVAKHKVLRDIADGKIKPPPLPPGVKRRVAPPPPPPPPADPSVPDFDIEPTPIEPAKPSAGTIDGFQAGSAVPMDKTVPDTPAKREEAWKEIVDIASTDEFDITPASKPGPPPPKPGGPAAGSVLADKPGPTTTPKRKRSLKDDEWLKEARKAAAAYSDVGPTGVRHEVTSVRKPWGPQLRQWWSDLEPVRTAVLQAAVAAVKLLAGATVIGLQLAGRGLKALAGRSRSAVGSARAAKKRAAVSRADKARAKTQAKADTRARKAAAKAARQSEKAKRAERAKEAKQAKRKGKAEPLEPAAPPWEEPARPPPTRKPAPRPATSPVESPVFVEPPVEEAPAVDYAAAAAEVPLVEVTPPRKKRVRRRAPSIGPALRRFWWAPVGLAVVGLAVVYGPRAIGMVRGLTEDLPSRLPDVQTPSLPRVSLPRVTIRTPSFVETGVSRIAGMFSGPLLEESGEWLLVADVRVEGPEGESRTAASDGVPAQALSLALEADLRQARFFYVVPHERALVALRRELGRRLETLPMEEALALAAANGYAAVVAGRVTLHAGVDSVRLQVFNAVGDTLYGVAAAVSGEANTLETLSGLTRAVRRRLGEPGDDIEATLPPTQVLSTSDDALTAYAEARIHYLAGRYTEAVTAARRAASIDSTFAMAHRLLAEAHAMNGQRRSARSALENAWRFAERLTERERLRLLGDRHAWDDRLSEAALTYDDLFYKYRDDAGALRSQALMQRMIGVRGGGEGNLQVAYTIDPYDWPELRRLARYLGYRGSLPNVDSLVASLQE